MKVRLSESVTREVDIDQIVFPIFRVHDIGGDSYSSHVYTRIELDGSRYRYFNITHNEYPKESFDLEIDTYGMLGGGDMDYALGRGMHKSSREEFDAIVAKAAEYLKRFTG